MHSQKFVHSQCMLWSAFTVHWTHCIARHYYAFVILCIFGCCIPLHLVASCVICIHDLAHINAYGRIQLRAALLCMWDSSQHRNYYAFAILCIFGCYIPLHLHAFWLICILVVLHSCAFSRPHSFSYIPRGLHYYNCAFIVHVHAFNDCAFLSSCIIMHLRFFAFLVVTFHRI